HRACRARRRGRPAGPGRPAGRPGRPGAPGLPRTARRRRPDRTCGPDRPAGPAGPQGAPGPQGPAGGLSGYEVKTAEIDVPNLGGWADGKALCSAGKHPLGGGYWANSENVQIVKSQPPVANDGWLVLAHNSDVFSHWQ